MPSIHNDASKPQTSLEDVYAVNVQYRESLAPIRDDLALEDGQRRDAANDAYNQAVKKQQAVVDRYISERAVRRDDLTRHLFHGGGEFKAAVSRFALASNDELDRVADLARRTDDQELLRAVAVVGRSNGHSAIFHDLLADDPDYASAFSELEELGDARSDAADLRITTVKPLGQAGGPGLEDITPTLEAREAARERAYNDAARALRGPGAGVKLISDEARDAARNSAARRPAGRGGPAVGR